jgi:hypothetical protein
MWWGDALRILHLVQSGRDSKKENRLWSVSGVAIVAV